MYMVEQLIENFEDFGAQYLPEIFNDKNKKMAMVIDKNEDVEIVYNLSSPMNIDELSDVISNCNAKLLYKVVPTNALPSIKKLCAFLTPKDRKMFAFDATTEEDGTCHSLSVLIFSSLETMSAFLEKKRSDAANADNHENVMSECEFLQMFIY